VSVDQLTYEEFIRSISYKPIIGKIDHKELNYILIEKDKHLGDISFDKVRDNLQVIIEGISDYEDFADDYIFQDSVLEMLLLVTIECRIEQEENQEAIEGLLNIAIPTRELVKWLANDDEERKEKNKMTFDKGLIKTTVEASLGKTKWTMNDIDAMEEGTIIELDRNVGDVVPVFVDGKQIGIGEVVIVDEKFGVRVIEVFK
jgi:flagellar motor switch protein FliN/FliY